MTRRLILHIGLSKTGTTSIQAFLRGSPDFLAAHGVVYPDLAGERSSHPALAPSTLRRSPSRQVNHEALAMEIRRGRGAKPAKELHTPLWSGVFGRISQGNAHTVIVSYENFHEKPHLYQFGALAPHLERFDVFGLIYLRPQEDWLTSLYAQAAKGTSRTGASLSRFISRRKINYKYSSMLDEISTYLPISHLIVGDFYKASSDVAEDLLKDFAEKIGLPCDLPLPAQDRAIANRSLPHWATLFLLRCNQAQMPDKTFVRVRRLLGLMNPTENPHLRPGLDVATPEERESLRAAAAADADRLRERYGVSLTQRTREPIAYRPFDDEDVEAIRDALAAKLPRSALKALDKP